ncbi:hypothetical protein H4219_000013 [Mycoemilia scoparia]|uniref:RING-type E3 ubiquitin transferase n=1 Tax=Mycoemilia scoparia TaxID=417184 RepID=A0A9W8DXM8_9FUNG|nr:hypothetical protein H4219_000013 [Mycoemilia scoparia]
MNRFAVKTMWCMSCGVAQPIQRQCQNCRVIVAEYYCSICKLLDNDPRKEIYHCNDCGLCRCGPRHKYFHCKKCNTCMEKIRKNNHRCFERILDRNCPICSEYLFTSTEKASFMKCGHAIHESCLRKLAEYSYQCPICNKSLGDMSSYFERIDQLVASQTMPKEYAGRISEIFCNDCEQRSKAPFNFIYHKCGHCGSYSTTLIGSYGGNHVAASSPPISPAPPMGNHGYQSITQHHPQAITPEVPLSPSIPNQTDRNEMYQSNHTREPRDSLSDSPGSSASKNAPPEAIQPTSSTNIAAGSSGASPASEEHASPSGNVGDSHIRETDPISLLLVRQCLPEPAWEPDSDAKTCHRCGKRFTLFLRRHHCRRCGLIFCHGCSSKVAELAVPLHWTQFLLSDSQHSSHRSPRNALYRTASYPSHMNMVSEASNSYLYGPEGQEGRPARLPWALSKQRVCSPCSDILENTPIPKYIPENAGNCGYPSMSVAAVFSRSYPAHSGHRIQPTASQCSISECPVCARTWEELWPILPHLPGLGWQESQEHHIQRCLEEMEQQLGGRPHNENNENADTILSGQGTRSGDSNNGHVRNINDDAQTSTRPIPISNPLDFLSIFNHQNPNPLSPTTQITHSWHHQSHHGNLATGSGSPTASPQRRGARSIMGVRYIAYDLPDNTPLIDQECTICFEEFKPKDSVARLKCMCTYHLHCIQAWLKRTPACPVHYE